MDGQVNPPGQEGVFDFFGENALPADGREGLILNPVPFGADLDQLDPDTERLQGVADPFRLTPGQGAGARPYAKGFSALPEAIGGGGFGRVYASL